MIAVFVILAAVAVLLAVVATRPDQFRIERSTTIAAPPEVIFPLVSDFHQWARWSPWEKLDPAMKKTFSGAGVGAVSAWEGNSKAGAGRMTMTESKPSERVAIQLEFFRPMRATNLTDFTFKPTASGAAVNWSMSGHNAFMAKAFGLFMNIEQMVGKDFEEGLASLKRLSEAEAKGARS